MPADEDGDDRRCEELEGFLRLVPLASTLPIPVIGNFLGVWLVRKGFHLAANSTFLASKAWLLAFPFAWFFLAEQRSTADLRRTLFGEEDGGRPRQAEVAWGAFTGAVIGWFMYSGWVLIIRDHVDRARFLEFFESMGVVSVGGFAVYALAMSTFHAFMEEIVLRWFVFKRLKPLFGGRGVCDSPADRRKISDRRDFRAAVWAALVGSGIFVSYHVLSSMEYLSLPLLVFANGGTFFAGLIWSALYHATGNIWSGVISHFIADIVLFTIMGSVVAQGGGTT